MNAAPEDMIDELNERARGYYRYGMDIEAAIQQAVTDWVSHLRGIGYRILSVEEIVQNDGSTFFEALGAPIK